MRAAPDRSAGGDVHDLGRGDPEQVRGGDGEYRSRGAGCRPDDGVVEEVLVEIGGDLLRVGERGHPADGISCAGPHERKMSDFTIWATSQPTATAVSGADRVLSGICLISQARPARRSSSSTRAALRLSSSMPSSPARGALSALLPAHSVAPCADHVRRDLATVTVTCRQGPGGLEHQDRAHRTKPAGARSLSARRASRPRA